MGVVNSKYIDVNVVTELESWEIDRLIAGNKIHIERHGKCWRSYSIKSSGKKLQIKLENPDWCTADHVH